MKYIYVLVLAILLIFAFNHEQALGQLSILKPSQGGTGIGSASNIGDCIKVLTTSPFTYELGACGGGGGGTDGNWVYVSSGNYSRNATTTSGILTNGSSTIALLQIGRSTTTNATTTGNFTSQGTTIIGSLTGLLKAASGVVTTATAGTDYENPLTFSAPLSRAVNTISCITATWSVAGCLSTTDFATFQNKISSTSLSWTDTSQIDGTYTSSSGVFTASVVADSIGDTQLAFNTGQNLTTASDVTFSEATTTGFFTTVASSTASFMQTLLAKHATSSTFFTNVLGLGSDTVTDITGTGLTVSGGALTADCVAITGSAALCDGTDATGGGGGTDANWSYTAPNTYISPATSTNGIIVLASSTIGAGTQASGLTINGGATTTDLVIANSLRFNGVTGSTWASFCTTITGSAALCDGNDASGGGASFGQGWDLNTAGQLAPTTTKTVAAQAFVATSTATSTFTGGIQTAGLNATGFVTLMGETFTNFTTYVRSLITEGTGIDIASGVVSVEPDSIGDTQLTFNTGQHLTTTSDVTFSEATTTSFFSTIASSTSAFFTNLLASNATTTNLSIGGQLSFGGVSGTAWSSFCTAITGGAGLCDGTDDGGTGGGADGNWTWNSTSGFLRESTTTNDVVMGSTATNTAPFFFDVSESTLNVGTSTANPPAAITATYSRLASTTLTASTTMTNATSSTFFTSILGMGTDYISDLTGTALSVTAGALGITADSIGDTQLAFNTGQNLTTTSDVSFSEATTTSFFSTVASSTYAFFGNLFATNATTTGTHWISNLKLGNPLSTLYGGTGTSTAVLLYKPTAIQVTSGSSAITTGDGKAYFRIPAEYNGMNLVDVNIAVTASTTSNYIEVQLARGRQASAGVPHTFVDMLSTTVTIDTNEYDSQYSATTTVINSSNDDVTEGDLIRIDVDKVGSGPTAVLIVQPVFALP